MIVVKKYLLYIFLIPFYVIYLSCEDSSLAIPGNYKNLDQKNPVNGSVSWYEGYQGEQGNGQVFENSQAGVPLGALNIEDDNADDEHSFEIISQSPVSTAFTVAIVENEWVLKLNTDALDYESLISSNQSSDLNVSIRATDDSIEKLSGDFDVVVSVKNVNEKPSFTNIWIIPASANEGYPYGFDIDWNDPDAGDNLVFTVSEKPGWISWDAAGVISGTPAGSDVSGNNDVRLLITDEGGLYAQHDFTINVIGNQAPYFTGSRLTTALGNLLYEHQVTWNDPNPNDELTFSVLSHPDWLSWDSNGNLSGTPTESDVGVTNTVVISISDQLGAFETSQFNININDLVSDDFLIEDDSNLEAYAKISDITPSLSEDATLNLSDSETLWATSSTQVSSSTYTNSVGVTYNFSSSGTVYTYVISANISRDARGECYTKGKIKASSLSGFHYSVSAELNNSGEDGQTQLEVYCKNYHTGVYAYSSNSSYNEATDQKVINQSGDITSPGEYEFYVKFGIRDLNSDTVQDIPDASFTLTLEKI